jgi:hypothetical protein
VATASDNFNRANETPIAGNWTNFQGTFNLATNAATPASPASADAGTKWNANTFGADQFSQADLTVSGANGADQGLGLVLRTDGAASPTQYRIVADHNATLNISIARQNAGVFAGLKQVTQAWTDGDTWRVEIKGFIISVYRNGGLVTTFDDSASGSKIASGQVGIGFSSSETSASLDNWSGGDLAVASHVSFEPIPFIPLIKGA